VSDLGINPQIDGKVMRRSIPPMSEEQRNKLVGRVKDLSEQARVALRNLRRDQNKKVDDSDMNEDDQKDAKEEIQKILKQHEGEVDGIVESKTKEILEA